MRQRLGWLVRVNRRYGQPRFPSLGELARAFAHAGRPVPSTSALSRWETGVTVLTHDRIADYERALHLPTHSLTAVADVCVRYASATTGSHLLLARTSPDTRTLDDLLAAATTDGVMTGAQWQNLTAMLAAAPHTVLSPRSLWAQLTHRLTVEANIADGINWLLRCEALNRLVAHPAGQETAIAAVGDLALDRSVHSMAGTVSSLEATGHRGANDLLMRQIRDPITDRIFYGALLASVRKVRDGHFTRAQLMRMVGPLIETAGDSMASVDVRALARILIGAMPVDVRSRVRGHRLPDVEPSAGESIVDRVCATTWARLGADPDSGDDAVLREIVEEMVHHPLFDVRLYATFLLYSTPFRLPLAAASALELRRALARRDVAQVVRLVELLRVLGGPAERVMVEQMMLNDGLDVRIRMCTASALAHLGGYSAVEFFEAAIRGSVRKWHASGRGPGEAAVLQWLVYALGMSGMTALLQTIRRTTDLPSATTTAARWWLSLPAHITDSARR